MKTRDDLDLAMQHICDLQRRRHRLLMSGRQDPVAERQIQELDAELGKLAPVRSAYIRRTYFGEQR